MVAARSDLYQLSMWGDAAPVIDLTQERKKRRYSVHAPADALTVFSFGGGVQSMAALVLAAQGKLSIKTFLFSNVGEDSEHPATLRYFREVAQPFAVLHGLELLELRHTKRDGTPETIYSKIMRPGSKAVSIPVYMATGAPAKRACTKTFKIDEVARELRKRGIKRGNPARVALGISLDEWSRMDNKSDFPYIEKVYPLIDLGLDRQACLRIIEQAGLPIPPKSSCYFCPFHRLATWRKMRDEEPALFAKAAALETYINERRKRSKDVSQRDPVYLPRSGKPLPMAVQGTQQEFAIDDACGGYCGF